MKITAIVLSAGRGSRMKSDVHKQYIMLQERPVIAHTLTVFQNSPVDEIVLVTGAGEEEYCKKNIVDEYNLSKVSKIVTGGAERYHSVYAGLCAIQDTDYVLIHDGARPFVDLDIIQRTIAEVQEKKACIVGMPVKDTIKVADEEGRVASTPRRSALWMVQTPQAFEYQLVFQAYKKMLENEDASITDDAMVVEQMCHVPVYLIEGSYENIKITTPEDLIIADAFLEKRRKEQK